MIIVNQWFSTFSDPWTSQTALGLPGTGTQSVSHCAVLQT